MPGKQLFDFSCSSAFINVRKLTLSQMSITEKGEVGSVPCGGLEPSRSIRESREDSTSPIPKSPQALAYPSCGSLPRSHSGRDRTRGFSL